MPKEFKTLEELEADLQPTKKTDAEGQHNVGHHKHSHKPHAAHHHHHNKLREGTAVADREIQHQVAEKPKQEMEAFNKLLGMLEVYNMYFITMGWISMISNKKYV